MGFVIVLILSWWVVKPLVGRGYFPMHDDTQVARVVEMGRALRQGQFPVRWVSELGYGLGYPLFNFYGPLPYYVGGFFYALGFSGLTATKLMMGIGLVAAGVTMYAAVSDIAGISAGILSAVLYLYAPYHAVDAYVRGAVGEYWVLVFLPLIFWGFWKKRLITGSLGIAGLILSHTVLGYAGMVFVLPAVLAARLNRTVILSVVIGLGLSAFFWLPALAEMNLTNVASVIGKSADFRDHFVCLPQLWNSPWGFGGSAPGCLDGFSLKVGKVHVIAAIAGLAAAVIWYIRTRRFRWFAFAGAFIFLAAAFFTLPVSARLWEVIPLFAFVQYPWRFLAFAMFGISLSGAGVVYISKRSVIRVLAAAVTITAVLWVEAKWFTPQYIYERNAADFETATDIRWRASGISDEYLPPAVKRPTNEQETQKDIIAQSDTYELTYEEQSDTYRKFSFRSGRDNDVTVRSAYFPGWQYTVNENTVAPKLVDGLPVLTVPSGFTVVQMRFRNTPVRTVGNVVSLISLGAVIYLYDRNKNKKTIG